MKTAHASVHIDGPIAHVFDFMLDAAEAPKWRHLVTHMEWLDANVAQAGARARIHFDAGGVRRTQEIELADCVRPDRQVWTNNSEGFRLAVAFTLAPEGTGTRVSVDVDTRGARLLTSLLVPLVTRSHRERYANTLERLKRAVEAR